MIRLLYKTGSTITDYSKEVASYEDLSAAIASFGSADAIYIGMRHPFNHLYFSFTTPNDIASVLTFKIWDGTAFVSLAEQQDYTALSGVGFGQNGSIAMVPDRDISGWAKDDTDDIAELNSVKIYDQFWLKITCSSSMTNGVTFKYIGNKFCTANELYSEYPEFSRTEMKTAFSATDWEPQIVRASDLIVKDMISKNIMVQEAQILDTEQLMLPCVSRVAQLLYASLGDDYDDDMLASKAEYDDRLKSGVYFIDNTEDAILDTAETKTRTGFLSR